MGGRVHSGKATRTHASLLPALEDTPYVSPEVAAAEAGEETEFVVNIQE